MKYTEIVEWKKSDGGILVDNCLYRIRKRRYFAKKLKRTFDIYYCFCTSRCRSSLRVDCENGKVYINDNPHQNLKTKKTTSANTENSQMFHFVPLQQPSPTFSNCEKSNFNLGENGNDLSVTVGVEPYHINTTPTMYTFVRIRIFNFVLFKESQSHELFLFNDENVCCPLYIADQAFTPNSKIFEIHVRILGNMVSDLVLSGKTCHLLFRVTLKSKEVSSIVKRDAFVFSSFEDMNTSTSSKKRKLSHSEPVYDIEPMIHLVNPNSGPMNGKQYVDVYFTPNVSGISQRSRWKQNTSVMFGDQCGDVLDVDLTSSIRNRCEKNSKEYEQSLKSSLRVLVMPPPSSVPGYVDVTVLFGNSRSWKEKAYLYCDEGKKETDSQKMSNVLEEAFSGIELPGDDFYLGDGDSSDDGFRFDDDDSSFDLGFESILSNNVLDLHSTIKIFERRGVKVGGLLRRCLIFAEKRLREGFERNEQVCDELLDRYFKGRETSEERLEAIRSYFSRREVFTYIWMKCKEVKVMSESDLVDIWNRNIIVQGDGVGLEWGCSNCDERVIVDGDVVTHTCESRSMNLSLKDVPLSKLKFHHFLKGRKCGLLSQECTSDGSFCSVCKRRIVAGRCFLNDSFIAVVELEQN